VIRLIPTFVAALPLDFMSDSATPQLDVNLPVVHRTLVESISPAASCLPIELVLHILELLAIELRDSNRAHAVSLSLVSRAVRKSILPLLYEVLVLRITGSGTGIVGWNGRKFDHIRLAFLSWLLCNPSVPPRHHIKHLVFHHSYMFSGRDLADRENENASDSESESALPGRRWMIEDVIVTFPSDSTQLRMAGIHVRRVHWLTKYAPEGPMDLLSTRAQLSGEALRDEDPLARNCLRFWTEHIEGSETEQKPKLWTGVLQYQEIDPERGIAGRIASPDMRGIHIFLDIGAKDGFSELSSQLLEEIKSVFMADEKDVYQVVLVFAWDAPEEDLYKAARELHLNSGKHKERSLERIWLAKSTWANRCMMRSDPQTALARVIQIGLDPWDMGRRLSNFVVPFI